VRLIMDTHAALWFVTSSRRLSERVRAQIRAGDNEVLLSAVVVWEVSVKRSLGKLDAPADLAGTLESRGARRLDVTLEHAAEVERLPWHHRDPFDRLLIAQAQVERAVLATTDGALAPYGVPILW